MMDIAVSEVCLGKRRLPEAIAYHPGDCVAFTLSDGDYGGLIVLALRRISPRKMLTLVGLLKYKNPLLPTTEVFERREWLVLTHHSWRHVPQFLWIDPYGVSDFRQQALLIGSTPITARDPQDSNAYAGGWSGVGLQIELQATWDDEQRRASAVV
jgi:hypothetical protein